MPPANSTYRLDVRIAEIDERQHRLTENVMSALARLETAMEGVAEDLGEMKRELADIRDTNQEQLVQDFKRDQAIALFQQRLDTLKEAHEAAVKAEADRRQGRKKWVWGIVSGVVTTVAAAIVTAILNLN